VYVCLTKFKYIAKCDAWKSLGFAFLSTQQTISTECTELEHDKKHIPPASGTYFQKDCGYLTNLSSHFFSLHQAWEQSVNCKLIIMKGAGKNEFCAGDDVKGK
jgi:hypothetical protein